MWANEQALASGLSECAAGTVEAAAWRGIPRPQPRPRATYRAGSGVPGGPGSGQEGAGNRGGTLRARAGRSSENPSSPLADPAERGAPPPFPSLGPPTPRRRKLQRRGRGGSALVVSGVAAPSPQMGALAWASGEAPLSLGSQLGCESLSLGLGWAVGSSCPGAQPSPSGVCAGGGLGLHEALKPPVTALPSPAAQALCSWGGMAQTPVTLLRICSEVLGRAVDSIWKWTLSGPEPGSVGPRPGEAGFRRGLRAEAPVRRLQEGPAPGGEECLGRACRLRVRRRGPLPPLPWGSERPTGCLECLAETSGWEA